MDRNRSSVSKARRYKEIGAFWDTHDLAAYWEKTKPAKFEVDIQSEVTYYAVDKELAAKIQALAKRRGVSADTLLNMWVQEKLKGLKI